MTLRMRIIAGGLAILFAVLAALHALAVETTPWTVDGNFHGKKARLDISGITCPADTSKWCIAVNDDENYLQFFAYNNGTINPERRMRLLPKKIDGQEMDEIDAEGVAYANGFVYVTGSHGLARKKNRLQPSRFFVFRFPVSEAGENGKEAGKPKFHFDEDDVPTEIERTGGLRALLMRDVNLKEFAENPLDENGLNIEGLAVLDHTLYFGMRAPSLNGNAFILPVAVDCIFGESVCTPHSVKIPIGEDEGIRDLARFGDGILILSGPSSITAEGAASIWKWSPGDALPRRLAGLSQSEGRKAEGMLVLPGKVDDHELKLLIVYDDEVNGAPEEIDIPLK